MKIKDILQTIHVSQKKVKRRTDAIAFNRVIDFNTIVNPREMKGFINVGIFIHVERNKHKVTHTDLRGNQGFTSIRATRFRSSPFLNVTIFGGRYIQPKLNYALFQLLLRRHLFKFHDGQNMLPTLTFTFTSTCTLR